MRVLLEFFMGMSLMLATILSFKLAMLFYMLGETFYLGVWVVISTVTLVSTGYWILKDPLELFKGKETT